MSGGIDEDQRGSLNPYVDGCGVGTTISNARVLDFAMDIMEVERVLSELPYFGLNS